VSADVIIIGGGLIGMLTARELRQAGLDVLIVDRRRTGRESSWAGGGILSPLYPWRYANAVTVLARWSQARYAELCDQLHAESRVDPQWTPSGLLILGAADQDQALGWAREQDVTMQAVAAGDARTIEPNLAPDLASGVWLPDVAQVRNPRLVRALRASIERSGVQILEDTAVSDIRSDGGRVTGVSTSAGDLMADRVVVASGAWSGEIMGRLGMSLAVEPVRGQMIIVRAVPGAVSRIVLNEDRYVIPRRDGHVLIGSTLERVGFDKSTTDEARDALMAAAFRMIPLLGEYPLEYHWSGLRPGSPHGIPYIGEHPRISGLYVNAGHFRNGVVLGPASARLLGDLLLDREPSVPPDPYALERAE
jgi:glycine oxidase